MTYRNMMAGLALAVVTAVAGPAPVAEANETGVAGIHEWRKVGRKTCMAEHEHTGGGTGANRKAAEAAAIGSWASFTAFEYGSSWGNFRIAEGKRITCDGAGATVSCTVVARACRPF
jgi:hypothetical protein